MTVLWGGAAFSPVLFESRRKAKEKEGRKRVPPLATPRRIWIVSSITLAQAILFQFCWSRTLMSPYFFQIISRWATIRHALSK